MRQTALPIALLILVTGVLYLPTLGYPLVYEDLNDTETFLASTTLSALGQQLVARPTRALTEVSFAVNRLVFGAENPVGYHAGSVALHLVNVALVVLLAWQWMPPVAAILVASAFAVHPLNVEAVAYVSARAELVAASGVLLALLAASLGSFAGALCGVLLACLGKETAVMAWGLVPLWVWATRTPFPKRRWLLVGGIVAVAGIAALSWPHVAFGLDAGIINRSLVAVWRLVSLVFVPIGLTIDHDWNGVPLWLQSLAVGGIVTATLASLWTLQQRVSWWALAWLSTVLWFLPRFVVPAPEGLHDHHAYLIGAVWLLCAGAWLSRFHFRAGVTP